MRPVGATPISYANLPQDFTLLQVTPSLNAGGVETMTLEMSRAIVAAGFRSLVASSGGALQGELIAGNGEMVNLPLRARDPVTLVANALRLRSLIARENVSLVHVRSRAPMFSASMAIGARSVPLVASYHGIYAARSPLKRWYNGAMTRGDMVIANSNFTRDHILSQHNVDPARIVVIPEGVDTDRFDPNAVSPRRVMAVRDAWGLPIGDTRRVILLAARMTGWKGHRLIIQALARAERRQGAALILTGETAGATNYVAELRAEIAACDLTGQVSFVGNCDDMQAAFAAADLVVAPSTQAESFGRSVVEAGAMARPVLASNLGGHAETVDPGVTGWLVAGTDPQAWAQSLDDFLALDNQTVSKVGRAARMRVCRLYDLATMGAATLQAYAQVLERHR